MTDQQLLLLGIAVAILVVVAVIALAVTRSKARRRREAEERDGLRSRFGPEYDATVASAGGERAAATELADRERRRESLDVQRLTEDDRVHVRRYMAALQYRFVEEPGDVLDETARTMTEVMRVRGYPVDGDLEEGLRLFSVDHPTRVSSVRSLLSGQRGRTLDEQRRTFLEVRTALREAAGISWDAADVALPTPAPGGSGDDLRVEHADPATAAQAPPHR